MFRAYNPILLGELTKVLLDESTAQFKWTIPNCSNYELRFYQSPTVEYFKVRWNLKICVETGLINAVFLDRKVLTPGILEPILCTIRWEQKGGFERDLACDVIITGECKKWTTDFFRFSGRITFTCTLRKYVSPHARGVSRETQTKVTLCTNSRIDEHQLRGISREAQTEDTGYKDIFSLSEHLKNLQISGDGHDVLLKVGDKEFRAHKHILKVRSPVFAAMFNNDMAESAENSVIIEDCDPDAFGDFLQFVYSGAVDITSVGRALGLYYVADKYDYPKLKEMCVHYLKISFTTSTVFEVIQLAAKHDEKELQQQAIVYFANNLEEVMLTVEWQRFITANPIQGNEMSIKALQCLKSSLIKK